MGTILDLLYAGAILYLLVMGAAVGVLVGTCVYFHVKGRVIDWRTRRYGRRTTAEIERLDSIPFMVDWPVNPENRYERKTWTP